MPVNKVSEGKRSVLLVGTTGTGKSSLGNLLANTKVFLSNDGARSETKEGKLAGDIGGKYIIGDTMGLNDTEDSQMVVRGRITEVISKMEQGVDIFLLVLKKGRYDKATHMAYKYLFEGILGEKAYDNCIMVLTHCEKVFVQPKSKDAKQSGWLAKAKDNPEFDELFKRVGGRVVFISNENVEEDDDEEEKESKLKIQMLSRMDMYRALDQFKGGERYFFGDAKKIQDKFDDEEKKREEEKERLEALQAAEAKKVGEEAARAMFAEQLAELRRQRDHAEAQRKAEMESLIAAKDQQMAAMMQQQMAQMEKVMRESQNAQEQQRAQQKMQEMMMYQSMAASRAGPACLIM